MKRLDRGFLWKGQLNSWNVVDNCWCFLVDCSEMFSRLTLQNLSLGCILSQPAKTQIKQHKACQLLRFLIGCRVLEFMWFLLPNTRQGICPTYDVYCLKVFLTFRQINV